MLTTNSDTARSTALAATTCPKCGNTALDAARAVYEQGTVIETQRGSTGGVLLGMDEGGDLSAVPMLGSHEAVGIRQTLLATRLAPPLQPDRVVPLAERAVAWLGLGMLLPLGAILVWEYAVPSPGQPAYILDRHDTQLGAIWTFWWVYFAAFVAIAILGLRQRRQSMTVLAHATERWSRNLIRWRGLLYCARCDSVIDLERKVTRPSEECSRLVS